MLSQFQMDSKGTRPYISMYPLSQPPIYVCMLNCLSRVRLCDAKECSLPGSSVHGIHILTLKNRCFQSKCQRELAPNME